MCKENYCNVALTGVLRQGPITIPIHNFYIQMLDSGSGSVLKLDLSVA